jgi:hypothetical protein
MTGTPRSIASAVIGCLMVGGSASIGGAQSLRFPLQSVSRASSFPSGSIKGVVQDERGLAVPDAVVTAMGATTVVAIADKAGRFELPGLAPGPYRVRAHLRGYVTPTAQLVQVRSSARVTSSIALHRVGGVLEAGFGLGGLIPSAAEAPGEAAAPADASSLPDAGETAWRIRHSRRSILKDVAFVDLLAADRPEPGGGGFAPMDVIGRAAESSAHAATSFFADTPFSGQVNLLTSGVFDVPRELFSDAIMPSGTANASVSAPIGEGADWTARAAITQSDISSWMVAGSYLTRVPARHRYNLGMSYSTQRYDGSNPLALRSLNEGGRNAGEVYGFDTFALSPAVALTFGARYGRYDYLDHRNLVSPRIELAVAPSDRLRVSAEASVGTRAPGSEEFLPPTDTGIWLPPQRTFSSLDPDRPLRAETTRHAAIEVQRDIAGSTISVRAYKQHINDQVATLFGAEIPGQPVAKVGHYLVANVGHAEATGCSAGFSTAFSAWVRGSIEYSVTEASLTPSGDVRYVVLTAPSVLRPRTERIHDVATTVETRVPETATRVVVLYRISNGFARPASNDAPTHPLDGRFDVQVRQSLPFMDFASAKWEMLLAVRNIFHETAADRSVYDELLVVRPPKRIVGGLTMRF